MPRKRRPRDVESGITGNWWRCPDHGLTEEPICLGASLYCPAEACMQHVKMVHRSSDDAPRREWNTFVAAGPRPRRRRQESEEENGDPVEDADETEPATPGAPEDEPKPETAQGRPVPAGALILAALRAAAGRALTTSELRAMLHAERPAASRGLLDVTLGTLRKRAAIVKGATGWTLVEEGNAPTVARSLAAAGRASVPGASPGSHAGAPAAARSARPRVRVRSCRGSGVATCSACGRRIRSGSQRVEVAIGAERLVVHRVCAITAARDVAREGRGAA